MTIENDLNRLHGLRERIATAETALSAQIDKVLTPEILAQVEALRNTHRAKVETVVKAEKAMVAKIKDAGLELGETVKAEHLQAVWSKGRTGWDTKKLNQAAKKDKTMLRFKKPAGKPSVSIRKA